MSATPLFVGTALQYGCTTLSNESLRTTPTKYGTLVAVTANDISVPGVNFKAQVSVSTGSAFFFLYDGATNYLFHEEVVATGGPTASNPTTPEFQYVPDLPILVPAGWALRVSFTQDLAINWTTINAGKF